MANSSTAFPKSFLFNLLRVLFCLLSIKICNTSDLTYSDLDSVTLDLLSRGFSDHLGFSLNPAGDIDNDRFEDFILRAPSTNNSQGAVYGIYGGESSHNLSLRSLDPATTGFIIGVNANDEMLFKKPGDINDDGYDDILIETSLKEEVTYVIYGGKRSSMSHIDLRSSISGNASDFIANSLNGSIVIYGKETEFPNGNFRRLQICDSNCTTCSGSTCSECYAGFYPSASQCLTCSCSTANPTTCPKCSGCYLTYVPVSNVSVATCAACSSNCYTCSDYSVCKTCKSGDYFFGSQCYQTCPIKKWGNNTLMTCDACPSYCDYCSNSTTCTTCSSGYFLSGAQCVSTCPTATFGLNGKCESCITGCDKCTNNSTCQTCSISYALSAGLCVQACPAGTFDRNYTAPSGGGYRVCEACPTNCSQCSDASTCTTCFSGYFVAQNSLCQACSVNCDSCLNSTTCFGCSSGFFLYQAQCNATCPMVTFPSNLTGACEDCPLHCSSCISKKSCKTCDEGYQLSNALCVVIPSMPSSSQQAQQKASQAVSSAVTGAGSVLCVGSPTFPITALVSQIVQNTRYMNLTVTTELAEIYQTWGTEMISWEVPNTLSQYDDFKTSPLLFSQYGLGSSFLNNFWPTFMTIMVGLGVLVVSFMLRILLEKGQYRGRLFAIMQRLVAGSFNFVIVQVYGCLDDILFDLVLDLKTNPFNTFFSWTSVFFAVGFLAIGCSLVYMNMRVVYKYQTVKAEGLEKKDTRAIEIFNKNNKYWELFYSEFNNEDFWSQSALALFIIRGTLSSLTIAVFYDYPMMQTSFLVMLDGVVLLFLIIKKPFTSLRGKLAQYYFETITLIVHICTFILALQDTFPKPSDALRSLLCTSIMYLNTTLVGGSLCFMGIEIFEIIRLKEENKKYKKQQDIDNNIEDEKTISQSNQTNITMTKTEIEMQRSPNRIKMQPVGTLETSNLFSENKNNTSLSGMMMLKPSRTLDLSTNPDETLVLQDMETGGNEVSRQRVNQNRSQKLARLRHRSATKKKQQQQQVLDGLLLRNPTRHLREFKKPE